jgi:hypothetical protein
VYGKWLFESCLVRPEENMKVFFRIFIVISFLFISLPATAQQQFAWLACFLNK